MKNKLISIVIPCYASEKYLSATVDGIRKAFASHKAYDLRLILINDGSPDHTFDVIRKLCEKDERIIGIDLDRNYGQTPAKLTGIPFILGEYAVFMDDDGQHDPAGIFKLVAEIDAGYDLVYAQFPKMKESAFRRLASSMNHLLLSSGRPKGIKITSFFALSRHAIDLLQQMDSYSGSVGQCLFPLTRKVGGITILHMDRTTGSSHYTLAKLFKAWLGLIGGKGQTTRIQKCGIRTVLNP